METYNMLLKLADAMLSGKPVVIFDKKSEKLNRWILIKHIELYDDSMAFIVDNEGNNWVLQEWDIFTMEEFNKLSK